MMKLLLNSSLLTKTKVYLTPRYTLKYGSFEFDMNKII